MHWFVFSRQLTDSGKEILLYKRAVLKHTFHACEVEDEAVPF
jgi:hypothetical protein